MREFCMKTHEKQFARHHHAMPAFTLIELLVTISIIALVLGIAGPSTIKLFSTNADTQAYNMFSTQMALARAQAIESANYVGLHSQITDSSSSHPYVSANKLSDKCVLAIVAWDEGHNAFDLKPSEQPQVVPGSMAFGQIFGTGTGATVNSSSDYSVTSSNLEKFTTFTILFNPDGEITKTAAGSNIKFLNSSALFDGDSSIWSVPTEEQGATCVTMFDYLTLKSKGSTGYNTYLNETGQFIAANVYTGRLFKRE